MTHHRPKIARVRNQTGQGEALVQHLTCTCGLSEEYYTTREANRSRRGHLATITPPPEQRCQHPADHKCRSWDYCPLCADQQWLFGLGEVA